LAVFDATMFEDEGTEIEVQLTGASNHDSNGNDTPLLHSGDKNAISASSEKCAPIAAAAAIIATSATATPCPPKYDRESDVGVSHAFVAETGSDAVGTMDEADAGSAKSTKKKISALSLAALIFIASAVLAAVTVQNQNDEKKQDTLSKLSALDFNPATDCADVTARTIDYNWPTYFPTYLPTESPVEEVVSAAIGSDGEKVSLDVTESEDGDETVMPSGSPIDIDSNDVETDDNFFVIYDDYEEDNDDDEQTENRVSLPEIFERRSLVGQSTGVVKGSMNDESAWSVRRKMLKSLSEDARKQKCVDYVVESIMAAKTSKTPKTPKTPKSTSTKESKSKKGGNPSTPSPTVSRQPSSEPSKSPSETPSLKPSRSPSDLPSKSPSDKPSFKPSQSPSDFPSKSPSDMPSLKPSQSPSDMPSLTPSQSPSDDPSRKPSKSPSDTPTSKPSTSQSPSGEPSFIPSVEPSSNPTNPPVVLASCPASNPSVIGQNCQFNPTQVRPCCLDQNSPQAIICSSNCNNCGLGLVSTVSNADQDCCVDNGSTDVGGSTCDAAYKYCCKRALTGAAAARYECFNEDNIPSGLSATAYCASL